MIDEDLREMFAERERFVPDPARVAARIRMEVRRQRGRVRVFRAVAIGAAVVGLVVAVGAAVAVRPHGQLPPVAPTTGAVPAPTSQPSPAVGRLVTAPDARPAIAVSVTWLPSDLVNPRIFTDVALGAGRRTITYERTPSLEPGTESVSILTYDSAPEAASPGDLPSWITNSDTGPADVNGHPATQNRTSSRSVGGRTCNLLWQQRSDLWVVVNITVRTTDTTLDCVDGLRVARGVVDQPTELARTVRLTQVPAGYVLIQTGTNLEQWCPDKAPAARCVSTQSGRNYGPAPGEPVTVHGHPGTLERTGAGFLLNVPGWIRIFSSSSDLTDAEILAMADTAVLDGGW
jgi:hypothetical protein